MTTPVIITTEVCVTALALGSAGLWVARQALRDGWVKASVSFGTVAPSVRLFPPKARERRPPQDSAGKANTGASPADPGRPPLREAG